MSKNIVTTKVKFTSKMAKFIKEQATDLNLAALQMATDVHRDAIVLAPKDSRDLVNSGEISKQGEAKYNVRFGGGQVPYARRRHFENSKNPQTLGYLKRAGDNVVKNPGKYIKKV